jgi:uncharacterized protein YaaQ
MLAIVQPEDADGAIRALTAAGMRATRISSMGAFLGAGNVTLLMGLEKPDVPRALAVLAEKCHTRKMYLNAAMGGGGVLPVVALPIEAEVGGANVFTIKAERAIRIGGGPQPEKPMVPQGGKSHMKLMVAITPEDVAHAILHVLNEAQYRATLISTTGGFLRKGNATLLIGVENNRVDDVVHRIDEACSAMPKAPSATSSATIFVLDVDSHLRI